MPPPLALALTLLLIGYLLRRDAKGQPRVSSATWIPTLWLMINGSRQVSQWIDGPGGLSAQALSEGNPVDKIIYSTLIAAAGWVLVRRRVRVGEILRSNLAIVLLLLYAALSVLWSEFPLISLKRWIKALGDPIMVLVSVERSGTCTGDHSHTEAMRLCIASALGPVLQVLRALGTHVRFLGQVQLYRRDHGQEHVRISAVRVWTLLRCDAADQAQPGTYRTPPTPQ